MLDKYLLQFLIAAQANPQLRALSFADITHNLNTKLGISLDTFQILLCQMAVTNNSDTLLVIPQAAVVAQDSLAKGMFCDYQQAGKKPKQNYCQTGEFYNTDEV